VCQGEENWRDARNLDLVLHNTDMVRGENNGDEEDKEEPDGLSLEEMGNVLQHCKKSSRAKDGGRRTRVQNDKKPGPETLALKKNMGKGIKTEQ